MADFGEQLSSRELEVLGELAKGSSNKEVAQNLFISPNTVKVHVRNVFAKLGSNSRTEAVTTAIQQGLLVGLIDAPAEEPAPEPEMVAVQEEAVDVSAESPLTQVAPTQAAPPQAAAPQPAAQPAHVPTTAEPIPTPMTTTAPAAAPSRSPWLLALGALALLAVLGAAYFLMPTFASGSAESTAVPAAAAAACEPTDMGSNWAEACPLPNPLSNMAVASIGSNIYLIGGETDAAVSDSTLVYETRLRTWQTLASKPTAVADAAPAVLAGQIYVPGGRDVAGDPTTAFEVYSPSNDGWQSLSSLPKALSGAVTIAHADRLFLFGGWNGETASAESFVYDPSDNSWRPIANMQQPRAFATGGIVGTDLFVVGGLADEQELKSCEKFDPVAESWSACPDMLEARGGASAVTVFSRLYVLGGGLNGAIPYGELYDDNKEEWQVVNLPMLESPESWVHLGVVASETSVYVVGGERSGERQAGNYMYNTLPFRSFIPAIEKDGE